MSDGTYPFVWNNDGVDASFGITSKIFLDQLTTQGVTVNSLEVPNSSQRGTPPSKDQMVTSFSSKSEIALNLSTDGKEITFMGYLAPVDAIDVSNSNTPGVFDPTDPVPGQTYRVVADVDAHWKFRFTETNAYSGNNGRAAVLNNSNGANLLYLSRTKAMATTHSCQAHTRRRRDRRRRAFRSGRSSLACGSLRTHSKLD